MALLALHVLKDPLPAMLHARCAAAALHRWQVAPSSADLVQQRAADSEGGASHTQQSNLCSRQQLGILDHRTRLHRLSMFRQQNGSRHYATASKAARVLPADAQSKQYNRSALLQAVARIAQQVGTEYLYPDDTPLVGVTRPVVNIEDVYACSFMLGPRSNTHHYWLQPLTYVQAAVAYDLGRSTVLGPQYTVNFHPDLYSNSDRELMRRNINQWRPSVFALAVLVCAEQPPLTYDCLQARKLADKAVTSAAESLAQLAKGSNVDVAVADVDFRGCTSLSNGTYRAVLLEYARQSDVSTKAADSAHSRRKKKIFYYRTYKAKLAAAVAADAMRQALGKPARNFPADMVAPALPAMRRWMQLNRLRLTAEQEEWAAKAATLELAPGALQAAAGVSISDRQEPGVSATSGTKGDIATSVDSNSGKRRKRRQR